MLMRRVVSFISSGCCQACSHDWDLPFAQPRCLQRFKHRLLLKAMVVANVCSCFLGTRLPDSAGSGRVGHVAFIVKTEIPSAEFHRVRRSRGKFTETA
eukprot:3872286-Alexandrium_andersonii.AAC.2